MKQIRPLIYILLIFYLFSSFASVTHIHKHHQGEDDCKICIIVKNIHVGDVPNDTQTKTFCFENISPLDIYPTQIYALFSLKSFNSQAPPLFSLTYTL